MKIQVTQKHIDEGKRRSSSCCPVSLALKDVFKVKRVYVDYEDIRVGFLRYEHRIVCWGRVPLPREVYDKIIDYDVSENGSMKPFEFELDLEGVKL